MTAPAEQEVSALIQRYLPDIQARLREAVPEAGRGPGLPHLLRYHMGWEDEHGNPVSEDGGKALRPVLCIAACEMAGGDPHRALPAAVALELTHNFSLIHDDIQDGDLVRRGRPALWSVRGPAQALTAGNAMRVIAGEALVALSAAGVQAAHVAAAGAALEARTLEMIEGQYLDMAFEQAEAVTTAQYLDMVARKTGALVDAAMFLGALVATGDLRIAGAFGACGRRLGVAFQVRDDYLGVWGDPAATGKPVGADIRRKKKSFPIVYLFEHAPSHERAWLDRAYAAREVAGDDVERVLSLLERVGAPRETQHEAQAQAAAALDAASSLALSSSAVEQLQAVAEFFVTRER